MSWGSFNGINPGQRVSITIDSTASAATGDVQILIPDTFSPFWEKIDASGYELRVTAADGVTVLSYKLASFNKTTRAGYIQIDDFAPAEATVCQVWLYFDMSGAPDKSTAFVYAASKTGYIYLGAPGPATPALPERPGDAVPRDALAKVAAESRWFWFDFGPRLQRRFVAFDGYDQWEEIYSVSYDVQAGGVSQAAMITATSPKIVGGRFVQVLVAAGTSGTDYTLICTAKTRYPPDLTGQTLQARALLRVKDPKE